MSILPLIAHIGLALIVFAVVVGLIVAVSGGNDEPRRRPPTATPEADADRLARRAWRQVYPNQPPPPFSRTRRIR